MSTMVEAPRTMIEAVPDLHFPSKIDHRMQDMMDLNNNGCLTAPGREELESLVELSERIAIVRAQALHILGQAPR